MQYILTFILLLCAPVVAAAQFEVRNPNHDFAWLVGQFLDIINLLIPFVFALALLVFLWGLMQAWILGGGDEKSIEKGKHIALAGLIGLVVMAGVWGIVALFSFSLFY